MFRLVVVDRIESPSLLDWIGLNWIVLFAFGRSPLRLNQIKSNQIDSIGFISNRQSNPIQSNSIQSTPLRARGKQTFTQSTKTYRHIILQGIAGLIGLLLLRLFQLTPISDFPIAQPLSLSQTISMADSTQCSPMSVYDSPSDVPIDRVDSLLDSLRPLYSSHHQSHLFDFVETLTSNEKQQLYFDLTHIQVQHVKRDYDNVIKQEQGRREQQ